MHTRPDGDLENLAIEKCTARDLKVTLLHSASHAVLDLVALTCLTSWMRGVPCSFYLGSTYALTFTSQCSRIWKSFTFWFVLIWQLRQCGSERWSRYPLVSHSLHSSFVGCCGGALLPWLWWICVAHLDSHLLEQGRGQRNGGQTLLDCPKVFDRIACGYT